MNAKLIAAAIAALALAACSPDITPTSSSTAPSPEASSSTAPGPEASSAPSASPAETQVAGAGSQAAPSAVPEEKKGEAGGPAEEARKGEEKAD